MSYTISETFNYCKDRLAALEVSELITNFGSRALLLQCDVSNSHDVREMVKQVLDSFGKIDILVNNAGIFISSGIESLDERDWDQVMEVNAKGVFLCSQSVGQHMIQRKSGGCIINIASISAHLPEINGGAYTPSKAAVIGLTKLLALEWAKHNIRVNAISPGPIMTDLQRKAYPTEKLLAARNLAIPMRRHGTPEEIAKAVVYLASDEAGFLTGEEITVDGGSHISMFELVRQLAGPEKHGLET